MPTTAPRLHPEPLRDLFETRVRLLLDDVQRCRYAATSSALLGVARKFYSIPEAERERIVAAVLKRLPQPNGGATQKTPTATILRRERTAMTSPVKRHKRTTDANKVSYPRWQYARQLIEEAQQQGHSLSKISQEVKGDGGTPQWAASAKDYRSQVQEADIAALERLVGVPEPKKGLRKGDSHLDDAGKKELAGILFKLREDYGWTNVLLGSALGMTATSVGRCINKGGGTESVLARAKEILTNMEAPAPNGTGDPEPEPQEDASAPQKAEAPTGAATPAPGADTGMQQALDRIAADLLACAGSLDDLAASVPPAFRQPWRDMVTRICDLAAELT